MNTVSERVNTIEAVGIHPTANIHPAAIIDPSARIGERVEIGPWSYVGADVSIGADSCIHSHVVVKGPTTIGKNNTIYQFASVGEACQDKKYAGEPTRLEIGDHNIIREFCSIHRGTIQDKWVTSIGSYNLIMAYTHVAHDCVIGDHCIFANNTALAGHVKVGNYVILGGYTSVHQFCHIGDYSMTAGNTSLFKDLPAFVMGVGTPAKANGMNYEGMRRRGYSKELINTLRKCYKAVYRQGLRLEEAIEQLETMEQYPEVQLFIQSLKSCERGTIR